MTIRDDATAEERTLAGGFTYDAFVVQPNQGATTGGTRVSIVGSGTSFDASTTVAIDGTPCTNVTVSDPTHLDCTTPADTPGAKDVAIVEKTETLQAADAFTYSDSTDGYRGGLSGGTLAGTLHVLAFDAWTGAPIADAYAIAGLRMQTTNAAGITQFQDASLTGAVTVTVAATCHQPLTFVAVPVDTVTAYLRRRSILRAGRAIRRPAAEDRARMRAISRARSSSRASSSSRALDGARAAKDDGAAGRVRLLRGYDATDAFYLPDPSTATTPDKPGSHGYPYSVIGAAGERDISARWDSRTPGRAGARSSRTRWAGARRATSRPAPPRRNVDIPMTTLLDHQVTLAPSPPAPDARGPIGSRRTSR